MHRSQASVLSQLSKSHLLAPKWGNFRKVPVSGKRTMLGRSLMIMVMVIALAVSTKIFLPFWPIYPSPPRGIIKSIWLAALVHMLPPLGRKLVNVFTALHLHSIRIRFDFAIAIAFETNCTFYAKPWVFHMNSKLLFNMWSNNFKGLFLKDVKLMWVYFKWEYNAVKGFKWI